MNPRTGRAGWALLTLLSAVGCGRDKTAELRPSPSAQAIEAPALLEFSRTRHDFGAVVQGELLKTSFELQNVGQRVLHLEPAARAQTCEAEGPTELAPGARAELAVSCRAELHGPLRVSLPVRSNDARTRELELTAEVTPLLAFDTELVALEMPFGEERRQEVRLRGARASTAKLSLESDSLTDLHFQWLAAEAGALPGFVLRHAGKRAGTFIGNLVFRTGLDAPSEIRLPYSIRVQGTLTVTPTNPYFNLRASGPKVLYVEVSSRQRGFRIDGVSVRGGPFAAELELTKPQSARIKLTVLEDQLPDEARSALGTLEIRSNDASEPLRSVPLFGFGHLNRTPATSPSAK